MSEGTAHARYVERAAFSPRNELQASWQRCLQSYNLRPDGISAPPMLSATELREAISSVETLLTSAEGEVKRLFSRLADHDYMVSMATTDGITVKYRCDQRMLSEMQMLGCVPGSIWREELQGTNGVGTCIKLEKPVAVNSYDHFGHFIQAASCVTAPIFGPYGKMISVLNVTTPRSVSETSLQLITGIVERSARRIGNAHFRNCHADTRILRLSRDGDFTDIGLEGWLALDDAGIIVDLTLETASLLRVERDLAIGTPLSAVLPEADPEQWRGDAPVAFRDANGRSLFAMVALPAAAARRPPAPQRPTQSDAGLAENIRIMRRLIDRKVPVMLQGETGTGKSVLARQLHEGSHRAAGPFVQMNCAAIPHDLIEAELFGYSAGAFTGAAREGARGKLVAANGGTLFLDEVGDMPLALQTRLLQVLSDGSFTPLGGSRMVQVDIAILSASLHDIPAMVERGDFRGDLFHRLNGAIIELTPLRMRADKASLIAEAFRKEGAPRLAPGTCDLLYAYRWPGNLRELAHVARYAAALVEGEAVQPSHLPPTLHTPAQVLPDPDLTGRDALRDALAACDWNVTRTARHMGISRATLHRRIARFGLARH